jgi:5-methylcytosine-specific restriction endonuclease McrBC regulatory subunit McrC
VKLTEQYKELLVYPEKPVGETAKSKILNDYYIDKDKFDLRTTNIMGVISYSDNDKPNEPIPISIGSRFDEGEKQHFFTYILSQVFDFNINIVDWKPQTAETFLDILLVFLFIHHLEKAYKQGLFKQYVARRYNEYNFKGALDVQRHIKENIPSIGKVVYKLKEMSYDNTVLHLIRYTTDYVHNKYGNLWRGILTTKWTVNEAVRVISEATPSYSQQNRFKIYHTCLKPIRHPFYTEYDGTGERIYGILFDGAWLWECYIAKLLKPLNFKHLGEYQTEKEEIFAFVRENENGKSPLYPDFYNEEKKKSFVLDAKYKQWDEKTEEDQRGDIHQILAYMYVTKANIGGIIFPKKETDKTKDKKVILESYEVWRHPENHFYKIAFPIPKTNDDNFLKEIKSSEDRLKEWMCSRFS